MGPPVRVALLGGGTFARSAYLPLLTPGQTDRTLIGIWSRTRESAESAAGEAGGVPSWHGEEGLQEVLARPDVDAVIVVVAAQATLQVGPVRREPRGVRSWFACQDSHWR